MRITTQMLNEGARKAKLPIHQSSLLDYVYRTGNTGNSIQQMLQAKTAGTGSRRKYEKQEKAADELSRQVQTGLYEKCENAGDYSPLYSDAQRITEKYNSLLSSLDTSPDAMDAFYRQSLKDIASSNRELLAEVGITAAKDGKLQLNSEKMKAASPEKLRDVFGEESSFMQKLQFLAGKVSDHAGANLKSASGSYSSDGIMNYFSQNKFDFWR